MHVLKRATSAIRRLRGRFNLAVEKIRKNELDYERAKSGASQGERAHEDARRHDSGVERFVSPEQRKEDLVEEARRLLNGQERRAILEAEAAARRGPTRPVVRKPATNGRH